jgi:hypothetical protein
MLLAAFCQTARLRIDLQFTGADKCGLACDIHGVVADPLELRVGADNAAHAKGGSRRCCGTPDQVPTVSAAALVLS